MCEITAEERAAIDAWLAKNKITVFRPYALTDEQMIIQKPRYQIEVDRARAHKASREALKRPLAFSSARCGLHSNAISLSPPVDATRGRHEGDAGPNIGIDTVLARCAKGEIVK